MLSSFRIFTAAAIAGVIALIGLGVPTVLARQGTGTHPGAAGIVQSVDGSSTAGSCGSSSGTGFTVKPWKTSSPTWTVVVGSGTTFYEVGTGSASFADLCVGDWAGAYGTTSGTTVTATKVWFSPPGVSGRVESVNGVSSTGSCGSSGATGSFTLGWQKGTTWTIDVTGATKFTEHNSGSASFANLCVGDWASARGTKTGTTLAANSVVLRGTGSSRTPSLWPASGHPQWTKHQGSASVQFPSSSGRNWQGASNGASADSQVRSGGGGWGHGPGSHGPPGGSGWGAAGPG
ncbi:MAG: DUF5666 domain-containing protein [Candidatus Dormiibacterota bacterium]